MGDKRPYKPRKPGAGRKPLKPNYDAAAILQEQIQAAVVLYEEDNSLQTIADTLSLNPIKVRKLLITAGVYESEIADAVNSAFEEKQGMPYKEALEAVAAELNLSKASVTSYLPYKKGVYFRENCERKQISVVAEGLRRMRQRKKAVEALQSSHDEQHLWKCVVAFQGYRFKTISGLPFSYKIKTGRNGELTKELWIDRRESSKSLTWSSVLLVFEKTEGKPLVERPKELGDIRGVSYIYGMFYRFELIEVPQKKDENQLAMCKRERYLTLEDDTLMQWCVDNDFCGEAAKAVRYDSDFVWEGESWPEAEYIISEKDRNAVRLENFCGR